MLKQVGLTSTVSLVVTPGKTVGTVSGSSPPVNTKILTTLPVTLLVEGPTTVVPSVVSLNVGYAIEQLKGADLQFQQQEQLLPAGSTVADGQVLSQSLNAGTPQKRGTVVVLIVSMKAPPTPTPTPKASKTKSPAPKPSATPSAAASS